MSTRINTNIEAMNAQRNLSITAGNFAKSVEKLSSGLRINRAADDAAGLAISQGLDSQVNGLNQAQRNAQDGISLVQTAEGALNESQSILQRMRELTVQAGTATVGPDGKAAIKQEMDSLTSELNRIANTTTFNGVKLIDGSLGSTAAAAGAAFDPAHGVSSVSATGAAADTYTATFATSTDTKGLKITLTNGSGAEVAVADNVAVPGAGKTSTINLSNGVSITLNENASKDTTGTVTVAGGNSQLLVGSNASANDYIGFTVADSRASALGTQGGLKVDAINVSDSSFNADTALKAIDAAITSVSATRAGLGAVQNRLEHTIASLGVASENMSASESRIKDLDVAAEMVKFTKTQILQQAGTAILAQANSAPQNILTLLR
jgi:flagellin